MNDGKKSYELSHDIEHSRILELVSSIMILSGSPFETFGEVWGDYTKSFKKRRGYMLEFEIIGIEKVQRLIHPYGLERYETFFVSGPMSRTVWIKPYLLTLLWFTSPKIEYFTVIVNCMCFLINENESFKLE